MAVVTNTLNVNREYFRMNRIGNKMKRFFVVASTLTNSGNSARLS